MDSKEEKLLNFLKKKNGLASYADIMEAGFSKIILKNSLTSKRIHKVDRSLYRLAEGDSLSNPDLVTTAIKVPHGVVCLISALSFHNATDEVPRYVHIAIPRGSHANKVLYPPVKYYRFNIKTWEAGIEEHKIDGRKIKVYCLAKTVADCFKFRNRVGVYVAREALKIAVDEKKIKPKEIMEYAKICRVARIIRPTLEAIL